MEDKHRIVLHEISTVAEYMQFHYEFHRIENWYPSKLDGELFLSQGGFRNFFVGFIDGAPFCTFSFVEYPDQSIAHFGHYYTVKEFRGKGLTFPLFFEQYQKMRARGFKIQFTGANHMLDKYKQLMQISVFGGIKELSLRKSDYRPRGLDLSCVLDIKNASVEALSEFDFKACGYNRATSVRNFASMPGLLGFVYQDEEGVQGYAVVKPVEQFWFLRPFICRSEKIAEALMEKIMGMMKESEVFWVDVPLVEGNQHVLRFYKDLGFEERTGDFSLVGQTPFKHDFSQIYSLFAYEIGI